MVICHKATVVWHNLLKGTLRSFSCLQSFPYLLALVKVNISAKYLPYLMFYRTRKSYFNNIKYWSMTSMAKQFSDGQNCCPILPITKLFCPCLDTQTFAFKKVFCSTENTTSRSWKYTISWKGSILLSLISESQTFLNRIIRVKCSNSLFLVILTITDNENPEFRSNIKNYIFNRNMSCLKIMLISMHSILA